MYIYKETTPTSIT